MASDPAVGPELLWHSKFSLREEMVPKFIEKSLAKKVRGGMFSLPLAVFGRIAELALCSEQILSAGKSIMFIRLCMKDSEWVIDSVVSEDAQRGSNFFLPLFLSYVKEVTLNSVGPLTSISLLIFPVSRLISAM